MSVQPVSFFQRSATAFCTGMPPPSATFRPEKSIFAKSGWFMSALNSVFTPVNGELVLLQFPHESGNVARIGDEDIASARLHHEQAVVGEREDVIKRQGGDDRLRLVFLHER